MGGPGGTVLVVDDDASIRLLCRINLELEGYHVLEAETLSAAREALREADVRCLLLDLQVAGEDGLTLLGELRRERPELKVALLTGTTDPAAAREAGADALLAKPFELSALSATVRRLLGV